jgi:hypothetical protein
MHINYAARIVVTFLLVTCVIWVGRSSQFYTETLVSTYFAFTLVRVVNIHLHVHPSWRDALLILC